MNAASFARALRELETFEMPSCAGERALEIAGVRMRVRLSSPRLAAGALRALAHHAVATDAAEPADVTLLVVRPDGHVGLRADREHPAALAAYQSRLRSGRA